jgi:hypothetical protein
MLHKNVKQASIVDQAWSRELPRDTTCTGAANRIALQCLRYVEHQHPCLIILISTSLADSGKVVKDAIATMWLVVVTLSERMLGR